MKKSAKMIDFKEAQRQSPVAILLILYKVFRIVLRQSLPIIVVVLLNPKSGRIDFWGLLFMGLATISAISSIMSYFRFFYFVDDTHFHIRKGWIVKSNISIPIERIQTIDFSQNPIHKIFNVVQLDVDTAGSASKEINLNALKLEDAERLRAFLYSKKGHINTEKGTIDLEIPRQERLLHKLELGELIKLGLVQNHLRTAGIIIAFGFTVYGEISEIFEKATNKFIEDTYGVIEENTMYSTILSISVLFFLSIIGSIIVVVGQNFNLRFTFSGKGYKVVKGLLNKKQTSISLNKIQLLRWSANYLQRRFNMVRLSIYQAASIMVNAKRAISIPGLRPSDVDSITEQVFSDLDFSEYQLLKVHRLYIVRRMLMLTVAPLFIIIIANLDQPIRGAIITLVWLIISIIWSYYYYKNYTVKVFKEGVMVEHGVLTRRGTVLEWKNIQSIGLHQSPIQKRRALNTIHLYTAAGSLSIPFIEEDVAGNFRDYAIQKVETSQKAWM